MRVFLVEKSQRSFDLSSAEHYGELNYLFSHREGRPSLLNAEAYQAYVLNRLKELEFDLENDLFCVTGSILAVTQAMAALVVYAGLDRVNLLLFNSSSGLYEKRTVDYGRLQGD